MSGQPPGVVDRALGDDETHGVEPTRWTSGSAVGRPTPRRPSASDRSARLPREGVPQRRRTSRRTLAMAREISMVGVVGLGTMGAGIAEVMARNGLEVIAVEADESRVAVGRGHVEQSTARAVARGKLSEVDQQALLGRIRFTATLEDVAAAQLVVEAVPENLDLKREIF